MAQGDKFWGAPWSEVGVSCLSWCKPSELYSTLSKKLTLDIASLKWALQYFRPGYQWPLRRH
ncbi:hypothetical protein SFRURICE_016393 [Spodoptera frugiperda]|uniref:SFRICE_005476 n=1 Tax=Spodoptera frugiperda TaxID=7108 RepID=A0A2H1VRP8_SPOFR|nr:hypothetical protein SFRURICE_016393 [Spodoptera frugiperda]